MCNNDFYIVYYQTTLDANTGFTDIDKMLLLIFSRNNIYAFVGNNIMLFFLTLLIYFLLMIFYNG